MTQNCATYFFLDVGHPIEHQKSDPSEVGQLLQKTDSPQKLSAIHGFSVEGAHEPLSLHARIPTGLILCRQSQLLQVHEYRCLVMSRRDYYNMVLPSLWFFPSSCLLFCDGPWVLGVRVILLVRFVTEPSTVTYSLPLNPLWASVLTIHCMLSLLWWGFLYSPQLRHGNRLRICWLMNRQGQYGVSIQENFVQL